jgi:hypothetical protein
MLPIEEPARLRRPRMKGNAFKRDGLVRHADLDKAAVDPEELKVA